jgi:hypothetical protein
MPGSAYFDSNNASGSAQTYEDPGSSIYKLNLHEVSNRHSGDPEVPQSNCKPGSVKKAILLSTLFRLRLKSKERTVTTLSEGEGRIQELPYFFAC